MTSKRAPLCGFCIHYHRGGDKYTCRAFPGGIPEGIIDSEIDHRLPVEGDRGIQFDPDPERAPIPDDFDSMFGG